MCDHAEILQSVERKAIKQHRCDTCNFPISKGERYDCVTAKWDGQISTVKRHFECVKAETIAYAHTGHDECTLEYGITEFLANESKTHERIKKIRSLIATAKWRSRHLRTRKQQEVLQ